MKTKIKYQKANIKDDIMLSLSKVYVSESLAYQRVSKALNKLTLQELDNLMVMIMTSKS